MRKFYAFLMTAFFAVMGTTTIAQEPGYIVRPAGTSDLRSSGSPSFAFSGGAAISGRDILNPNADNYVSTGSGAFTFSDDVSNSEIKFKPVPPYNTEPYGDLRRGPSHLYSDFVPSNTADKAAYYMYYRGTAGSEALMFRLRMGSIIPGSKGYSILLDVDGKFGGTGPNADPNYVASTTGTNGNSGFELEIVLMTQTSTQTGIALYNVDGASTGTLVWSALDFTQYSQVSLAGTNDNGDPDFYLDFFIPFAKMQTGTFPMTLTSGSSLRIIPTTVMSPQGAVGGPKSDLYGLSDGSYGDPNAEYEAFIQGQGQFTPTELNANNTTTPTSLQTICTAAPVITQATVGTGTAQVSGTWSKLNNTFSQSTATIYLYKNGSASSFANIPSVSSDAGWSISSLTIATNDVITAKAQGTGETLCATQVSNSFTATNCTNPSTRPVAPTMSCITTSKGTGGTNKTTGWTIWVNNTTTGISDNSVTNAGATGSTFGTETGTSPNITWVFSAGCSGGSNMAAGSYRFWYVDANGCQSDIALVCAAGNGPTALASATPLIAPAITSATPFTTATKTISGTASAGSTVILFVNGVQTATTLASGTISNTITGTFSFSSGLNFKVGDVISFTAAHNTGTNSTSYCGGKTATTYTVECYTSAPKITVDAVTGLLKIGSPISGTSNEAAGTSIKVYNSSNVLLATTTVSSSGSWTTSGASFSNGFTGNAVASTTYYATATVGSCIGTSANAVTASSVTNSNRCGTITANVPSGAITSSTTSITIAYNNATNLTVTLYEDGQRVLSQSGLTGSSTVVLDVTNLLYSGDGATTGILTIGVQEAGLEEYICLNTYPVECSAPTAPSYSFLSCTSCTGNDPSTIQIGGTITYRITSPVSGNYYSIRNSVTGASLSYGKYATAADVVAGYMDLTTIPLTKLGNQNAEVVVTSITGSNVCSENSLTAAAFIVLPINVVEFTGKRNGTANLLIWKTAEEINASHIDIERSENGIHYKKIGAVGAKGSNSSYNFTDINPLAGNNYYRLKLVDLDGRFKYSTIVLIKQSGAGISMNLKPNPFVNNVSISLNMDAGDDVMIMLVDGSGREVQKKQLKGSAGLNQISLGDLDQLLPGIYLLKLWVGNAVFQQKLVKISKK